MLIHSIRFVVILIMISSVSFSYAEDADAPYIFTYNGKPFTPNVISLSGNPKKPHAGDVIRVHDFYLTLGTEKLCAFKAVDDEDKRTAQILVTSPDGKETVVGVKISYTYEDKTRVVINSLEKLTDEQIAGLWGICIDAWFDAISQKVQKINPARTCVCLNSEVATGPTKSLPPLPDKLAHLVVYENSNHGIDDYTPLARLTQLKFFYMRSMSIRDLDAALLKDSTSLQYLCLQGQNLQHPEALGSLHSLRYLNLMWADKFQDLSFAKNMTELRTLDINHTNVADLTPLSELAHLTDVNANQTPVEHLPTGKLATLKSLKIMSSKLAEADVNTFKTSHPNCKVEFGWVQSFSDALTQCTRLRVRTGGTDDGGEHEKTIYETKDAKEISGVIEQTKINEAASGFHCMCGGEPTFEFYNNDTLIVVVGFHHGRSLRWNKGWPGDAMLTPESSKFYCEYLAAHGVTN